MAGGYDLLCRFVMRGFDALRSLTRERIRPFDRRRSGLLLGEAAALVLLTRQADAPSQRLGRLLGHASTSDGAHIAAPDPSGRGLETAIRSAMAQAGVAAGDVDFVSAHGTATPLNDPIETAVLKRVLGARARAIPVNSIKGGLGHTMGAAATLEAIMCLLASRHGMIPPTLGSGRAGSRVRPRLRAAPAAPSVAAREREHLGRLRRVQRRARAGGDTGVKLAAVGVLTGWGPGLSALPADARRAAGDRPMVPLATPALDGERFRRATRECLLGVAAVGELLQRAGLTREAIRGPDTGLVYVTAGAYGASNRAFIDAATVSREGGGALHFPYTAPSAVPAEVAIEFGLTGPYVILIGGATATLDALWQAERLLADGACRRAIVLAVETFAECADLYRRARWVADRPLVEAAAGSPAAAGRASAHGPPRRRGVAAGAAGAPAGRGDAVLCAADRVGAGAGVGRRCRRPHRPVARAGAPRSWRAEKGGHGNRRKCSKS